MTDEETYWRWDEVGRKIDAKLYPFRWILIAGGMALGILAAIYF